MLIWYLGASWDILGALAGPGVPNPGSQDMLWVAPELHLGSLSSPRASIFHHFFGKDLSPKPSRYHIQKHNKKIVFPDLLKPWKSCSRLGEVLLLRKSLFLKTYQKIYQKAIKKASKIDQKHHQFRNWFWNRPQSRSINRTEFARGILTSKKYVKSGVRTLNFSLFEVSSRREHDFQSRYDRKVSQTDAKKADVFLILELHFRSLFSWKMYYIFMLFFVCHFWLLFYTFSIIFEAFLRAFWEYIW